MSLMRASLSSFAVLPFMPGKATALPSLSEVAKKSISSLPSVSCASCSLGETTKESAPCFWCPEYVEGYGPCLISNARCSALEQMTGNHTPSSRTVNPQTEKKSPAVWGVAPAVCELSGQSVGKCIGQKCIDIFARHLSIRSEGLSTQFTGCPETEAGLFFVTEGLPKLARLA